MQQKKLTLADVLGHSQVGALFDSVAEHQRKKRRFEKQRQQQKAQNNGRPPSR